MGVGRRSALLLLRCVVEDGAPETLRVRVTVRRDLEGDEERVVTVASTAEARRLVGDFLAEFDRP